MFLAQNLVLPATSYHPYLVMAKLTQTLRRQAAAKRGREAVLACVVPSAVRVGHLTTIR